MIWFWLAFFALVALLLVLDLGVLHRTAKEPTLRSAAAWTAGWVALGLSFSGVVYLIYEHHWLGAHLAGTSARLQRRRRRGGDLRLGVPARAGAVRRQHLRDVAAVRLVPDPGQVPAPRAVLGDPRSDRLPDHAARRRRLARRAVRLDLLRVRRATSRGRASSCCARTRTTTTTPARSRPSVRVLRRFVRIVDGDHGGKFIGRDRRPARADHASRSAWS